MLKFPYNNARFSNTYAKAKMTKYLDIATKIVQEYCGEPATSLHSHTVPLVQWSTCLLPVMRDPSSIPRGCMRETGILLLALSRYIGDPDVIDHCGLVWGRLCTESPLGCRADKCDNPTWSHSSSVPVSCSLKVLLPALQLTRGLGPKTIFIPLPLLKMIFFPPLATCRSWTLIMAFLP